jgi:hypothetical protein
MPGVLGPGDEGGAHDRPARLAPTTPRRRHRNSPAATRTAPSAGEGFPSCHGDLHKPGVEVEGVADASQLLGRDERCAATDEGVIHGLPDARVVD